MLRIVTLAIAVLAGLLTAWPGAAFKLIGDIYSALYGGQLRNECRVKYLETVKVSPLVPRPSSHWSLLPRPSTPDTRP